MLDIKLIILPLVGIVLGWIIRWLYARFQLSSSEQKAARLSQDAVKEAEAKKRELVLETKDQLLKERAQQEKELRERRNEIQRLERRSLQREENLDKKSAALENQERAIVGREDKLKEKEHALEEVETRWKAELERVAGHYNRRSERFNYQIYGERGEERRYGPGQQG